MTSDGTSQSTGLRPTSGAQWLIDPNNPDQLVPIGAMGEIVLESHETMTGYLNDSAKTDRAFIECPAWADKCHIAAGCKYLRLGDLGRYERDGSITIFGRADTQVKVRLDNALPHTAILITMCRSTDSESTCRTLRAIYVHCYRPGLR